jgi:hypothetical protein
MKILFCFVLLVTDVWCRITGVAFVSYGRVLGKELGSGSELGIGGLGLLWVR